MECLAQRPDERHKQQEEASCERGEEIQASVSIPSGDALEFVTKSSNNIPQHASETDTDAQMETIVQPLTNNVIGNAGPDTLLRVEQFSLVMQQQDQYQQQQQQKHHRDSHNHQPRQTNCCPSPLQRPIATQYLDDDQQHLNCYPHLSNADNTGSTHIHHPHHSNNNHQKKNKRFSQSKVGVIPPRRQALSNEAEANGEWKGGALMSSCNTVIDPVLKSSTINPSLPSPVPTLPIPSGRNIISSSSFPPANTSDCFIASPSFGVVNSNNERKVDQFKGHDNDEINGRPLPSIHLSKVETKRKKNGDRSFSKLDPHQELSQLQTDQSFHSDHLLYHGHANEQPDHEERPRVCKLLSKHPSVKLEWRVPEPIKAGGEVLRGVLVICTKELSESEAKAAVTKSKNKSKRHEQDTYDRNVRIEHIQLDLTGIEALSVPPTTHPYDSSSTTSTTAALPSADCAPPPTTHGPPSSVSTPAVLDSFQPGCLPPGTQQGISFQMKVPEKVGGTFKSAHASVRYQLTARVHIRRGKEAFVLQHPLTVFLFELVQIRPPPKVTPSSSSDPNSDRPFSHTLPPCTLDTVAPGEQQQISACPPGPSSLSTTVRATRASPNGRLVVARANSVLGTAVVKPYSLWGLGPATASSRDGQGSKRSQQRSRSYDGGSSSSNGGNSTSLDHAKSPRRASYHPAMSSTSFTSQDDVATIPTNAGPQENEDLHCQIQQQQPHHACQRFNSASSTTSSHCSSNPRAPRRETADGLDEVGFGARIDKSVAAAGDLVTLDMFVVKSDLMKVVDIKVSLVETIQVFSLLDNGKPDDVTDDDPLTATKKPPRRKLVDTHVVKIAKDYVPPHSEENHANDNHLKGYYEDYEDFRTTKSLSVYKLALRLPEHALTLDLELLKTEYMFVIKFFFKGRMGAFLELPIEIVSQYNLNRISTISGAMSCISNSVQIALPPVPVLVQQDGGLTPESDVVADKDRQQLSSSPSLSTPPLESDHVNVGGNSVGIQSLDVQDDHAAPTPEVKTISQEGNQALDEETFAAVDQETVACHHSPIDMASGARVTAQEQIPVLIEGTLVTEKSPQNKSPPTAGDGTDDQEIVCSSRLSKTESEACRSNVARIAAALMAKDAGIEQKEQAAQVNPAKGIIPKIVVDNSKSNHTSKSSSSRLNFASRRESSSQDKESSLVSGALTSGPSSATSRPTRTTTAVSPALPILFDLTSAGLPSPSMHAPSPAAVQPDSDHSHSSSRSSSSSNSSNENRTTTAAKRSLKTSLLTPNAPGPGSIGYSRCTDMSDPSHKQQLLHVGPLGGLPSIVSNGCPSDDDGSLNGDVRPSQHHNGLVAKIAKSLSSPLLRTRNNNGNGSGGDNSSSPSGSSMNLALLAGSTVSPQQQSTAFTLAATTLTLLSSVGQVAGVGGVVTSGGMILQDGNIDRQYQQHLHPRRSSQPVLSSRPLKSCLKKRRNSVPPSLVMSGLRPPPPMQGTAAAAAGGMSAKKKVTFAKGSTPLPSPNASQTFLPSLDHNGLVPPHRAIQCHPKQQQQQQQQQYLAPSFESPMTLASIPYSQPSAPSSSQVRFQHPISINPHQQQQQQQQRRATGTSQVYGPASTNSPSPRSRMYHPFDNHPSRLSPLEKQRLDFQLKVQNPVRGGHNEYPEHEKRQGGRAIVGDNDEDEEEEEDMLHEAQDREEDDDADNDDDDDRETEEERIERRRQARAAWLAKYGDAFKQVYGAVPELPPI